MISIVVYRSAKSYEVEMVSDAFKQNGIPFYRQEINAAGLVTAYPAMPTMGPGTYWEVLVFESFVSTAKEIISTLPVNDEEYPEYWGFNNSRKVKLFFIIGFWGSLIFWALVELFNI